MKPHPDLTVAEVLKALLEPETLPDRVGGGASVDDRVASKEAVLRIAHDNPDGIRVLCIGCSLDVPLSQTEACACGGFVCAACIEAEGREHCDHVPPIDPEGTC